MKRKFFGRIGKCWDCGSEMTLRHRFFGLFKVRVCLCGSTRRF